MFLVCRFISEFRFLCGSANVYLTLYQGVFIVYYKGLNVWNQVTLWFKGTKWISWFWCLLFGPISNKICLKSVQYKIHDPLLSASWDTVIESDIEKLWKFISFSLFFFVDIPCGILFIYWCFIYFLLIIILIILYVGKIKTLS